MAKFQVAFKKVVEFDRNGKRFKKVTSGEAKQYAKGDAIYDIYESSPGVPSFGWFVPVDAKTVAEQAAETAPATSGAKSK